MYHKSGRVVKFTVNQRAAGNDNSQNHFRDLQANLRNGESTEREWQTLLTRTPDKVCNLESFKTQAVKLSYGNQEVAKDNYESLKRLNQPIAVSVQNITIQQHPNYHLMILAVWIQNYS